MNLRSILPLIYLAIVIPLIILNEILHIHSQIFILFSISYPLFLIIVSIAGSCMMTIYKPHLSPILRMQNGVIHPNMFASFAAQIAVVLGAIIFALPHTVGATPIITFFWGAMYGLILYGFCGLTNFAILTQWPFIITLVDIGMGMCINGIFMLLLKWIETIL